MNNQSAESNPVAEGISDDLLYRLHDTPPIGEALLVALQHLLAVFGGIIAPPLLISRVLGFDIATTSYMVSMALFVSGVATAIQVWGKGPFGSGLLSIQGTSFTFVPVLIIIGQQGGLPLILGVCALGSLVEIIASRFVYAVRRVLTPVVPGVVVTMIGISLVGVGATACGGGPAALAQGPPARSALLLAGLVFASVLFFNSRRNRWLRMCSIALGLAVGYLVAAGMGKIDWSALRETAWVHWPQPLKYGMRLEWSALLPVCFLYLVTTLETIGDLTATSQISREPIHGPLYLKRVSGGLLADGLNSLLAAVFNTFPNTTFSQNNGVIQITGVACRTIGFLVALLLVGLGLCPAVSNLVALMPPPVLGGATILMFGMVAAAGIRILASQPFDRRTMLVIAAALGAGLAVETTPSLLTVLPVALQTVFRSSVVTSGITALLLQAFLAHPCAPGRKKED